MSDQPRLCPVHKMPDCSPILNGCAILTEWTEEPTNLLAVVQDGHGRRYFRWSHDNHTFSPWGDVGAVHVDIDDCWRWDDLVAAVGRLRVVSDGIEYD